MQGNLIGNNCNITLTNLSKFEPAPWFNFKQFFKCFFKYNKLFVM